MTTDHPPCRICNERCGSQTEHIETNSGKPWATCSGCHEIHGDEGRTDGRDPAHVVVADDGAGDEVRDALASPMDRFRAELRKGPFKPFGVISDD
jgi:hypothetical protein